MNRLQRYSEADVDFFSPITVARCREIIEQTAGESASRKHITAEFSEKTQDEVGFRIRRVGYRRLTVELAGTLTAEGDGQTHVVGNAGLDEAGVFWKSVWVGLLVLGIVLAILAMTASNGATFGLLGVVTIAALLGTFLIVRENQHELIELLESELDKPA